MTEPGGPAWRQTTFYPFATTARLARGRSPGSRSTRGATRRRATARCRWSTPSRRTTPRPGAPRCSWSTGVRIESTTVTVDLAGFGGAELLEALTLADAELHAKNTLEQPERVGLTANASVRADGTQLTIELPAVSWTAISLAV